MENVSEAMVRAAFARHPEPLAVLVTLEADGLDAPLRFSSDQDGTVSRGLPYRHFPFNFTGGGASNEEVTRGVSLEIGNTDGRIAEAVRAATGTPIATIETVRVAAPDVVELAIEEAPVSDVEIDNPKVTANLLPRDFRSEPACQANYNRKRTPGLF